MELIKKHIITFQELYKNYTILGNYSYFENKDPIEICGIIYKNNELYIKFSRNISNILTFDKIIGDLPQCDMDSILERFKNILINYKDNMAYTRTINVNGSSLVETVVVLISFSYRDEEAPSSVSFNFTKDNCTVYGNCDNTKITNYNSSGIITDEFMLLVQAECIRVLKNYLTI